MGLWLEYATSGLWTRVRTWVAVSIMTVIGWTLDVCGLELMLRRHDRELTTFEYTVLRGWRQVEQWERAAWSSPRRLYGPHYDRDVDREYALYGYEMLLKRIELLHRHERDVRVYGHTRRGARILLELRDRFVPLEVEEYLLRMEASELGLPVYKLQARYGVNRPA